MLDPTLTPQNVTAAIQQGLAKCSHLLAILSEATAGSWWVPFEIGVATAGHRRIAAISKTRDGLPDYLKHWPVLESSAHLSSFIALYRVDHTAFTRDGLVVEAAQSKVRSSDSFRLALKRLVGQS